MWIISISCKFFPYIELYDFLTGCPGTHSTSLLTGERQPQDTGLHKEKLNKFFKQFDLDGDGESVRS